MSADSATTRWEALLDELEADIHRTKELLVRPPASLDPDAAADDSEADPVAAALALTAEWAPPADLGPLPDALRGRAEAVANQQRELTKTLNDTMVTTRAHLRVTQTLRQRNAPQAVYIDTLG